MTSLATIENLKRQREVLKPELELNQGYENDALRRENERLRAALKGLLACCEVHPAFQKESNTITAGRVKAAREVLK